MAAPLTDIIPPTPANGLSLRWVIKNLFFFSISAWKCFAASAFTAIWNEVIVIRFGLDFTAGETFIHQCTLFLSEILISELSWFYTIIIFDSDILICCCLHCAHVLVAHVGVCTSKRSTIRNLRVTRIHGILSIFKCTPLNVEKWGISLCGLPVGICHEIDFLRGAEESHLMLRVMLMKPDFFERVEVSFRNWRTRIKDRWTEVSANSRRISSGAIR